LKPQAIHSRCSISTIPEKPLAQAAVALRAALVVMQALAEMQALVAMLVPALEEEAYACPIQGLLKSSKLALRLARWF
jgi:hypothetical protein